MKNSELDQIQKIQEAQYKHPYHYMIEDHSYNCLLNIVKEIMFPYYNKKILDAACGDAKFCNNFKHEKFKKLVGIDYSERAINWAKKMNPFGNKWEFYVQDLSCPTIDEKFDYIAFIEALEHIKPELVPTVLKNISKLLKTEGKLIITVPSDMYPVSPKHYQHFNEKSLSEILKVNFRILDVYGYCGKAATRNYNLCKSELLDGAENCTSLIAICTNKENRY